MVTTKERTELRAELVNQGYTWEYVDGWPPKITLYRHTPIMSEGGEVISPIGTKVENLPGNPDYVLRKSRLGLLPYLPSDTCECRWCATGRVNMDIPTKPEDAEPKESVMCQGCGEEVFALTKAGALSRLRVHAKTHQVSE